MSLDRFKLRYYDNAIKFMGEVIYLNIKDDYLLVRFSYADEFTPNEEVFNFSKRGVLMQCTGLEDKNDKLIYDGDIVLVKENEKDDVIKYIIDWSDDNAGFCLRCQEPNHPDDDIYGGFHNLHSIEIIGNIYECQNTKL